MVESEPESSDRVCGAVLSPTTGTTRPPVSLLGDSLRELSEVLLADWALVGGLAVSTRVEPRLTRDIDIAVAVAVGYF